MLALLSNYWRVAIVAVAFLGGWMVNGWRHEAQIAELQRSYAEQVQQAATEASKKLANMAALTAAIDQIHTKEMNDAQKEITRLRASISAGTSSLFVNATCTAGVPKSSGSSGVGNAARPRLTDAAQRDYFTLRERITLMTQQLSACQELLKVGQN